MNKIEAIKVLMDEMKTKCETAYEEATLMAILALLDTIVPDEPVVVKEKPKAKPKTAGRKKKTFDVGKAMACHKAGWSVSKIADEMGVSQQTVYKYLKEAEDNDKTKDTM